MEGGGFPTLFLCMRQSRVLSSLNKILHLKRGGKKKRPVTSTSVEFSWHDLFCLTEGKGVFFLSCKHKHDGWHFSPEVNLLGEEEEEGGAEKFGQTKP